MRLALCLRDHRHLRSLRRGGRLLVRLVGRGRLEEVLDQSLDDLAIDLLIARLELHPLLGDVSPPDALAIELVELHAGFFRLTGVDGTIRTVITHDDDVPVVVSDILPALDGERRLAIGTVVLRLAPAEEEHAILTALLPHPHQPFNGLMHLHRGDLRSRTAADIEKDHSRDELDNRVLRHCFFPLIYAHLCIVNVRCFPFGKPYTIAYFHPLIKTIHLTVNRKLKCPTCT